MKKIVGIFAIALLGGLVALGINQAVQSFSEPDNFQDMQKQQAKFASQIEGEGAAVAFDFVKVSEVSTQPWCTLNLILKRPSKRCLIWVAA